MESCKTRSLVLKALSGQVIQHLGLKATCTPSPDGTIVSSPDPTLSRGGARGVGTRLIVLVQRSEGCGARA